jgi:hypothetical protein
MDRFIVSAHSQIFLFAPTNLHTRRQDCDSSARCDRLTGKPEVTFSRLSGGLRRRCPEVGLQEVGVFRRQNNLTDGCLPSLTKRQKLCNKARARIFENLHLFAFLRAHAAERFSALDCAASTQSRANPFGRLGGVGRDHFQPHNRQRFASRSFAKPHCLACRMESRQSAGEFLNQLIPRNLRKRRLLRHSDLYRGFESSPSASKS